MNKIEGNKQLKSCPICGSKARIFTAPNGYYGVACDKIGCIIMQASYERSYDWLHDEYCLDCGCYEEDNCTFYPLYCPKIMKYFEKGAEENG